MNWMEIIPTDKTNQSFSVTTKEGMRSSTKVVSYDQIATFFDEGNDIETPILPRGVRRFVEDLAGSSWKMILELPEQSIEVQMQRSRTSEATPKKILVPRTLWAVEVRKNDFGRFEIDPNRVQGGVLSGAFDINPYSAQKLFPFYFDGERHNHQTLKWDLTGIDLETFTELKDVTISFLKDIPDVYKTLASRYGKISGRTNIVYAFPEDKGEGLGLTAMQLLNQF